MKKLLVMAAMVLSSVGAFAQQAAGTTTIQPKIGLNVATIGDNDWKAGLQPGFLVNKDDAEDVKTVDLSIPVGLSYEYQNLVFDARYNIGVTKVFEDVDHYNNVIQITIGYKFAL